MCFKLLWALQGLAALSYLWVFLLWGSEEEGLPMPPAPGGLCGSGSLLVLQVWLYSPMLTLPLLPVSLAKAPGFFPPAKLLKLV